MLRLPPIVLVLVLVLDLDPPRSLTGMNRPLLPEKDERSFVEAIGLAPPVEHEHEHEHEND